jgi:hypothetical protein
MGRQPKETLPGAAQLEELIGNLAKSGAVQYFLEIRRRAPGVKDHDKLWERWKSNLPAEDVEDIRDYCYSVGGDYWEYKVWVKDSNGNPVKGPNGQKLGPYLIPANSPPPPELVMGNKVPEDPDIAERQRELRRKRAEMELARAEAQLERDRRRLEKIMMSEDEDDDGDGNLVYNPALGGYFPQGSPMAYGAPPWMQPPWVQQWQMNQRSSDAVELAKAFAPVLTAVLSQKSGDKLSQADIIKLMLDRGKDSGLALKDMIGFIGPLMAEVTKATGDVNRVAMERMADSDRFWKEKLIEAAKLGGADDDEIDKWRKILGMATDTIREGAKLVFGRPTFLKTGGKGEVDVPVIERAKPPGLPSSVEGDRGKTSTISNPVEDAKRVVKERIDAFLVAHEQEMLIGSDPVLVADKLYEVYAMLPLTLRAKIEASDTASIYEVLRPYNVEVVDRILAAVDEDKTESRKKHCEEFWEAIKNPDEGGEGDVAEEVEEEGAGEESAEGAGV